MPKISDEARLNYRNRRVEELKKCLDALKKEDWDTIQRVGHKIKGNAETFGFGQLTPIALSLELAAQSKQAEEVLSVLNQLEKELAGLVSST